MQIGSDGLDVVLDIWPCQVPISTFRMSSFVSANLLFRNLESADKSQVQVHTTIVAQACGWIC